MRRVVAADAGDAPLRPRRMKLYGIGVMNNGTEIPSGPSSLLTSRERKFLF
jgi:hypothetical protein